jgi:predicted GIY-YIG superfamily endonuclease
MVDIAITCPECGHETTHSCGASVPLPPASELARGLLEQRQPWSVLGSEDREGQSAYRRQPAVYALLDEIGEPLYIGKTREPPSRWHQHRQMQPWWGEVREIAVLVMSDIHSAYVTEQRLIRQLQPEFNIRGR